MASACLTLFSLAVSRSPYSLIRLVLVTLCIGLLAACSEQAPEFMGSDISDTNFGTDLALPDTEGTTRSLQDFDSDVTVVFFGFTQCPDICPTALAEMAHTLELLEDDADRVQVAMITVDPERDTPDLLSSYVQAFDDRFIALRGSDSQLADTADSFKVHYEKVPDDGSDDYTMDHSASFYVFDSKGQPRVLIPGDAPADEIASDIRQLL